MRMQIHFYVNLFQTLIAQKEMLFNICCTKVVNKTVLKITKFAFSLYSVPSTWLCIKLSVVQLVSNRKFRFPQLILNLSMYLSNIVIEFIYIYNDSFTNLS